MRVNIQTVVPTLALLALIPVLLYATGNPILGPGLSLLNVVIISVSLNRMVTSDRSSR